MAQNVHVGDHTFRDGTVIFTDDVVLPDDTVTNAKISSSDPIDAAKLHRRISKGYSQANGTAVADATEALHVAYGDGEILAIRAGIITPAVGAATVTVDLKKNGTSVLTGVITIDNGDAAYAKVDGSIATEEYSAGDVLTLTIDGTAGGGTLPQGLFVDVVLDEDPA